MQHNSSRATTAPVAAAISEMLLLQSSDVGNSFRSEDSRDRESLALWEEKGDCQSVSVEKLFFFAHAPTRAH
jgi:hypothetical protein